MAGIPLSANFDLGSGIPLDSRLVKADVTARNALNTVTQRYEGMPVFVVATQKNYQLRGGVADANWVELVDTGGMIYPAAGLVLSTGTAWATPITPATGYLRYTGSAWEFKNETYVTGTPWTVMDYVTGTPWTGMGYLTSQTYPGAGIALSTGSAWGISITNSSANWNTAFGWGSHALAGYAPTANPVFTGRVGIRLSSPLAILHIAIGTDGGTAPQSTITSRYIQLGAGEYGVGSYRGIGFGYTQGSAYESPALIAYRETSDAGNTKGDLTFCVRDTTGATDVPTERMRILSNGTVKILGLTNGTLSSVSGILTTDSDARLKVADGYITDAINKVMLLKPRYFYWIKKSGLDINIRQLGFYAQEVNRVLGEEVAATPDEGKHWGIYDRAMIAMIVKAFQELMPRLEKLEKLNS